MGLSEGKRDDLGAEEGSPEVDIAAVSCEFGGSCLGIRFPSHYLILSLVIYELCLVLIEKITKKKIGCLTATPAKKQFGILLVLRNVSVILGLQAKTQR